MHIEHVCSRRTLSGLLTIAALSGCGAAVSPAASPQELRASLEKAEIAFAADTASRGVDGWVDAFADDGMQLDSKGRKTQGKDKIRERMTPVLAKLKIDWKPTLVEVAPSGEMGFTYGLYEITLRKGPPTVVAKGAFMTVWKRDASGTWKVAADIGSEDAEPEKAPPPVPPAQPQQ